MTLPAWLVKKEFLWWVNFNSQNNNKILSGVKNIIIVLHHSMNSMLLLIKLQKNNTYCTYFYSLICRLIKEYLKLLNKLYDITCSIISNIPYNLIFTTKFNDSSILISIISCDYLYLSLADEHIGEVTIPTQVIEYKYNQNFLQTD